MTNNTSILTFDNDYIKSKIYTIRGQQVMLDYDLAAIYGYDVKYLNRQVRRNIERFPSDFIFILSYEEFRNLKCQFGTSSWGGKRKHSFVFTEQGIYMLATVLNKPLAVKQSIAIIRLFKSMKDYIVNNKSLLTHDEALKISLKNMEDIKENKKNIDSINTKLTSMATKDDIEGVENRLNILSDNFIQDDNIKSFIIESNTKFEVDEYYSSLFKKVNKSLIIIDNYMSIKTLSLLKHLKNNINVKLITDFKAKSRDKFTKQEYIDFIKENPNISIKLYDSKSKVHDRFIILDYKTSKERILTSGTSIKDTGNKLSVIVEINDIKLSKELIEIIENKKEYEW